MSAGIVLGISFGMAWAATFIPIMLGRASLAVRIGAVSAAYLVCYLAVGWWFASNGMAPRTNLIGTPAILAMVIAGVVVGLHEVLTTLYRMERSSMPALSVFFLLATAWAPLRLHGIARSMWTSPDPGSVQYGTVFELAGIHLLAIAISVFLMATLWIVYRRRSPRKVIWQAMAVVASLVLSSIAMCWTVPGAGDEGTLLWLLLVPAALLVGVATMGTAVVTSILSATRASRLRNQSA